MNLYFQTWSKFATFSGRATRTEYWSFFLINNAIGLMLPTIIGIVMGWNLKDNEMFLSFMMLISLFYFLSIIPNLSLSVRRLHDINLSGWWGWLFIPLGLPMIIVGLIGSKQESTNSKESSPSKAAYSHDKNLASEITPTINAYKENTNQSFNESIDDDTLYEQAMLEIEENRQVKATWAKALANSDGNIDRANSLYIQMRVQSLKVENKSNFALKPDSEKNQEFNTIKLESSECDIPVKREEEKSFLIKFLNGEFLLWKTFFVSIFILIIIGFLQAMLYNIFSEKLGVLITIDTFFYIIIFILLVSSWNSATLQSYISFTFVPILAKAIIFILFLFLFGLINESIKLFGTI